MAPSPLSQSGVLHLRQAIPLHLLKALRAQLRSQLPLQAPGGIDRLAIRLHHQQPGELQSLQRAFTGLPAVFELALHPKLGQLLHHHCGWPAAVLSPIFNLRAKLPWILSQSPFTTVPWHQDLCASDPATDPVELVTAWIPLTAASPYHGGLEVIPGSHRLGWLPHHRGERGPEVCAQALATVFANHPELQPTALDAQPGDLVLFDQLTLHRSLPNRSSRCRWSLDLRFAALGSSSGRPGLWSRDPVVGEGWSPEVAELVAQRQRALANPLTRIEKRVDLAA